ncbi:hypothetical protein H7F37_15135 [Winogradskyella sp. PAMC22761]|nr:hypothetical protein H7F37_15135 [Winogradskyella sp. PAMC22761]
MISIVVCHRDKKLLEQFTSNVDKTIGVTFEFQIIDNSENKYSIFEAYNLGVKQSKYDVICFAHEDLLFHTQNWGQKVLQHFEDKKTGMIGVVGGNAFPNCPAPWWNNTLLNDHLVHNIQHWKKGFVPPQSENSKPYGVIDNCTIEYHNPSGETKIKAVALDGLWMCAHKRVFETCKFDTETFKGFHGYDTDICLQVVQSYDIYVVYDILIEHLSMGTVAKEWANAAELLADKWKDKLPIFAKPVDETKITSYNAKCLLTYCYWMKGMGFTDKKIREIIAKYNNQSKLFSSQERLLLSLWLKLGYQSARIPYKILKSFTS